MAPMHGMPTAPVAPSAHEADERVEVRNIITPGDLQKIMAGMGGTPVEKHEAPQAAPAPERDEDAYPSVPINSKFTFENFVYGDENKHAYQSAVRFAALA